MSDQAKLIQEIAKSRRELYITLGALFDACVKAKSAGPDKAELYKAADVLTRGRHIFKDSEQEGEG